MVKSTSIKERIEAIKLAVKWTYNSSKPLIILIFIIAIISGLLTIIEPYIFKLVIDNITNTGESILVKKFGISLLGLLIIYGVARVIQDIFYKLQTIIERLHAHRIDQYSSKIMMSKISSLDMAYFEDPEYHNILNKANQNTWRVNAFFWNFIGLVAEIVSVLVIIGALFSLNWIIVALILGAALPSILLTLYRTRIEWSAFDSSSSIYRRAWYYRKMMMDKEQAIKEIKLFGLKEHFLEEFDKLFEKFTKEQKKAAVKSTFIFGLVSLLEGVLVVIAAWLVTNSFINGGITIGQLTFFWALLFQFAGHARQAVKTIGTINETATFITPVVEIMGLKSAIKEAENPKEFPKQLNQGIEFKNVTFYYPRAKVPALKNFNLQIRPGEGVALVGENGSGKTTLIKLLTRLYDVTEGEILIDGINIKEYSLKSLYKNLGIIFQDFMKYEALVEENIGYGNLSAVKRKSEIHGASLKAGAWEFVQDLEKKYKTPLGRTLEEKGVELSVGQWQKIALARAFFKDAQILCLDEPTAAVDAKAEYQLFRKFEELTKNKTTILISHRFSTVRMADKIIVIDKGRLIEQGSHRELLRKRGHYASLFRMQAEGYRDN